jgi:hypothetical protein
MPLKPDEEMPVTPDVDVEARFRGKGAAVKQSMKAWGGATGEDDTDDELISLLQSPKNMVIVKRTFPTSFNGKKSTGEVQRYDCPISVDDIRENVFENYGGKKFRISIHPSTPTGEMRTLHAFNIENPDEDAPFIEGSNGEEGNVMSMFGDSNMSMNALDPYAVPSNDPASVAEQAYRRRAKIAGEKLRMKELEKSVKELEDDGETPNAQVEFLQRKLEETERKREMDDKFSALEAKMGGQNSGDTMVIAMMKMMESSNAQQAQARLDQMQQQQQFFQMIVGLQKSNSPDGSFDTQLDRMVKMQGAMGGKSNKIEEIMIDMLYDKVSGGKPEEDDPIKYAIKEVVPVLKEAFSKSAPAAESLSPEEAKVAYQEAGRKAAVEIAQKMQYQEQHKQQQQQRQAHLQAQTHLQSQMKLAGQQQNEAGVVDEGVVANPPSGYPQPQHDFPTDQGGGMVTPPSVPTPSPTPDLTQPLPNPPVVEESTELPNPEFPPGPLDPAYDRTKAVGFVIDSIIHEIESGDYLKEDENGGSIVIGDFLEWLDGGLLTQLMGVMSIDDLSKLIQPYASKEKVDKIVSAGQANPKIGEWLTGVILTVKAEFSEMKARISGVSENGNIQNDNTSPAPELAGEPHIVEGVVEGT